MFPAELIQSAETLSKHLRAAKLTLVTAESCTGGLIASLLTELPGSSDILDRGFVTYSNEAKEACLTVPHALIQAHGAVSEPVARTMASGALSHSNASVSVAVTGVAGPGGGTDAKPIGLVHIASACGNVVRHREHRFGDLGRNGIRLEAARSALMLVGEIITDCARDPAAAPTSIADGL